MFGPSWESTGCLVGDVATLSCIFPLFQSIITALIILSGTVAVFLVIFAGFKFIRSGGDPKQVEGARHIATYAVLGLVIILLSFIILRVIATVTGVECLTQFGFTQCDPEAIPN